MKRVALARAAPVVALLLACGGAPAPPAATVEAAAPVAVADDRADELARRLAEAERTITSLEAQVSDQEDELATAAAEVERWKGGLDRCVAKLNEVSADADALAASTYAPVVTGNRGAGRARVHTIGAPTASVVSGSAVVTVRLWNAGDGDASGTVEIELICDGEVVDSTREPVELTPRTDLIVTATLRTNGRDESCTARAALDF